MDKSLLNALQSSTEPLTREYLSSVLGQDDRTVRAHIRELRELGYPVLSDSHGKGYWLARDDNEFNRFLAEYNSRAMAILKTTLCMKRKWKNKKQLEIGEN